MPAIIEMKPGEDKRWKQEKHCNGDRCVNHDGLFAVESVFDLDSLALCNGSAQRIGSPLDSSPSVPDSLVQVFLVLRGRVHRVHHLPEVETGTDMSILSRFQIGFFSARCDGCEAIRAD